MNNILNENDLDLIKEKSSNLKQLSSILDFFTSKPPSYWKDHPDEAYAIYKDLDDLKKELSQDKDV